MESPEYDKLSYAPESDKLRAECAFIEAAVHIARKAHDGQVDKANEPYLWHPIRVGMSLLPDVDACVVGILHDVGEDRPEMIPLCVQLLGGILESDFVALTRQPGELYEAYIVRASCRPLARKVKLADLADNLDPGRFMRAAAVQGMEKMFALQKRYVHALTVLVAEPETKQ